MNILVCGGAGYIGSHMVKMLADAGHEVVVFDNLSTGHREAVKWGKLVEGDLLNRSDLKSLFEQYDFSAVMHFSARSLVGESIQNPSLYYENNVVGTYNLLEQMRRSGVNRFIFSSTAATYGNPIKTPIDESHPKQPINPYGQSKLMVETMLNDYASAYGMNSVSLRYFNAAGADSSGVIGESHEPETHLIPNILISLLKEGAGLKVFGNDYETPDGTCVRDYIHIQDLCQAHLKAIDYLDNHEGAMAFNLGNGTGFSVLDIINAVEKVTGNKVAYEIVDRRPGDPPVLVADSRLATRELKWKPDYLSIDAVIETAWKWHSNQTY